MKKKRKANMRTIAGKKIAVLGFGSQGKAQALNLRDSGAAPLIGLPSKSKSRIKARDEGFLIATAKKAIKSSDIIAVLIPDHKHKELFDSLQGIDLSGKAFIFAHGLSVAFGLVKFSSYNDIIMVAPHGPGVRLRERYIAAEPFTAFIAVEQDNSGGAWQIAAEYANAIGCGEQNLFESTFRDEAVGDIFGEQAVLCGGLVGLLEAGFETLVDKGLSPQSAYLECVYQIDLIIDLIKRFGTAGMFERISKTAAFGSLRVKDKLFDQRFRAKMEDLYKEINSGKFVELLMKENRAEFAGFESMLAECRESTLDKAHKAFSRRLNVRSRKPKAPGKRNGRKPDVSKGRKGT